MNLKSTELQYSKIDDLSLNIFRHSFATNLCYAGVTTKDGQHLLGNSDPQLFLGVYSQFDVEKSEASEKWKNFTKKQLSQQLLF